MLDRLALRPPTPAEFGGFRELVHSQAGIYLADVKRALLVGRLSKRLRELGLRTFGEYLRLVREDDAERVVMLDCLCTNETHFFREPRQFEYLERHVFPGWLAAAAAGRRARRVRAWSAACSTGEEPCSLAMSLLPTFPAEHGWDVQVLASDLSTRALALAEQGAWPIEKAAEIPPACLRRFMLRGIGSQRGRMKAGPELRAALRYQRLNLNDPAYAVASGFDLILCRNVLIYFRPEAKPKVVDRLLRHLAPGGLLLLGHAESMAGLSNRVRAVGPNVYTHAVA